MARKQKGNIVWYSGAFFIQFYRWEVPEGGGAAVKKRKTCKLDFDSQGKKYTVKPKRIPPAVDEAAKEFMARVNSAAPIEPSRFVSIGDFFDKLYLVKDEKTGNYSGFGGEKLKHSTAEGYRRLFDMHLRHTRINSSKTVSEMLFSDLDTARIFTLFDSIARNNPNLRQGTLRNIKWLLGALYREAKNRGYFIGVNPVNEAGLPKAKVKPKETHAYSLEEVQAISSALRVEGDILTWTIVQLAAYTGLRRSEIMGLRWDAYLPERGVLKVLRSNVNGWEQEETKTEASKAEVALISEVRDALEAHRNRCGLAGQNVVDGPVFATRSGKALSLNNIQNRNLVPLLSRCSVCKKAKHETDDHEYQHDSSLPVWRGWHAFRRSVATRLHDKGVVDITIQRVLRHSDVRTTQQSYIKSLPDQITQAMEKLRPGTLVQ